MLALLGLTGTVLLYRDSLVRLPHADDPRIADVVTIAAATKRLMADPVERPRSIQFASETLGLDRLTFGHDAGAYADQTGTIIARWDSQWSRPELWLFDLHHHLFAGDVGEWVIGVAALCGLFFVISGAVLWWRTRKTFELRLVPKRMSRPAIVRHHRDLGIIVAPLLLLSLYTGAVFIFRPMSALLLGPGAAAEIAKAGKPPKSADRAVAGHLDWSAIIKTAHRRFPEAQLRTLALPREGSGLITLRMRQPEEWLPNGRTTLWFDGRSGALVEARDARTHSGRVWAYNLFYPLHAAKVGGLAFRMIMTISGLSLTMLGSLAVWSFWFGGGRRASLSAYRR